jgi:hypothetical protein
MVLVYYATKGVTTLASDPIESAKTAFRAVVCTTCDPSKVTPAFKAFNLLAKQYNDERKSFIAYETIRGNRHQVTSALDCATIGNLLLAIEPWIHRTFPRSPHDFWNIISGSLYASAYIVARSYDITIAGAASLYDTSAPATWICLSLFVPGVLLYPLSLRFKWAASLVTGLSPDLKKHYFNLLASIILLLFVVESISCFLSTFSWGTSSCNSPWSTFYPTCWFGTVDTEQNQHMRPSQGIAAFRMSLVSAITTAYRNPTNKTLIILHQGQDMLRLSDAGEQLLAIGN